MYRILIVEDDSTIASNVAAHLERWDYETKQIEDFKCVMEAFQQFDPQLVILDIGLPFYNGFYWCQEIRKISSVPILFLSSMNDNMNIVMAMNMGGDEFIEKPFDLNVLTAKVQALLRRAYSFQGNVNVLEYEGMLLNLNDASLSYRGEKISLTKNEFRILQMLMENSGKIIARDDIIARLWESDAFIDDNTLTVNVARLRKKLEKAGCHVIYGLVGLKTHSKITLVVRREETGIRRYVHLATGNYNDSTAKLYTDCGIFTCDERFGEDATAVFNMLSGYSEPKCWNKLIVAPIWMKDRFLSLIEREAENAKKGLPAHIRAKMNSLCDPKIMAGLYYASSCGVQVELLVRGICCLKVGIPGVSENIQVRSIVGTFLEHARIFYFYNDGHEEIYMGSADWMPRNLDRRVEIVFPVEDEKIKKELEHVLDLEFKDNVKAHILQPDGTYVKPDKRGKAQINSQMEFCMEATEKAALHKHEEKKSRVFIPAEPAEDIEE